MEKYIFVTGGVISGLGKGITAASLGRLLKARGYKVTMQKFDPYLNVDPGTMSPIQHGEVFVTEDGTETDLDLGHYERFIDENLDRGSNVTTGKVYETVLAKERHGDYGGGTVQVIPHVTNEIKSRFHRNFKNDETGITIVEIGGTIGDIESQPFFEAIRQFRHEVGAENVCIVIVSLIPYLRASEELKTKPTQMAVKTMQSMGLQPDIVVCRSELEIPKNVIDKISLFCNVAPNHVLPNYDCESVYELPLMLEKEKFAQAVCETLHIPSPEPDLSVWENLVTKVKNSKDKVRIALVGKYVVLHDAYISVNEALKAAGWFYNKKVEINFIDSETITKENAKEIFKDMNGIIVPGGFGSRGIQGMLNAIQYARENKVPFLGICLGMQTAMIEFARDVLGYSDADSTEFNPSSLHPVIALMPEQNGVVNLGGTMRLGSYPCLLDPTSKAFTLYGKKDIAERHRHRYEVNNDYREVFRSNGLAPVGFSPDNHIVEMVELKDHPFFVATQAHPEFKSRPDRPHPLFKGFIGAAIENKKAMKKLEKEAK
ncbi:MAG: CTP synthase [Candidatus Enterosoma sp.]|nr:CTP synthase [Bacilli bacterium]MDY3046654.1 CTP synthase [Candidatus Enterosoma sp.]